MKGKNKLSAHKRKKYNFVTTLFFYFLILDSLKPLFIESLPSLLDSFSLRVINSLCLCGGKFSNFGNCNVTLFSSEETKKKGEETQHDFFYKYEIISSTTEKLLL